MDMNLVNAESQIVAYGCTVHVIMGPNVGRAYRYEGVIVYGKTHRVKCTRKAVHGHFRSVEWYHPNALGCTVYTRLTLRQHVKSSCVSIFHKIDDWLMAGLFALIPLAAFEHFHLATKITEIVSLGMITGDPGSH